MLVYDPSGEFRNVGGGNGGDGVGEGDKCKLRRFVICWGVGDDAFEFGTSVVLGELAVVVVVVRVIGGVSEARNAAELVEPRKEICMRRIEFGAIGEPPAPTTMLLLLEGRELDEDET